MVNCTIAAQLNNLHGRIKTIINANDYLNQRIQAYIDRSIKEGKANPTPPMTVLAATHNTRFCNIFRPALLVAFEFIETCGKCDRGLGGKVKFEIKPLSDYMNDAYTRITTPEVSCSEVDLPDIIVAPFDETLFTTNGQRAVNFGTGALVTVSQTATRTLVHRGYNYDHSGGAAASTSIELDGNTYYLRVAADAANGEGSIRYTYVNGRGQFIAGPDGTAVYPDVDGFGAGGQAARVTRANWVYAADYLGIKMFKECKFSVEQTEIQKYSDKYVLNTRKLRMAKFEQRGAYDKMIGHETAYDTASESFASLNGVQPSGLGEGLPSTQYNREYKRYGSGLQTPKPVQESRDLIIPMFFQHNMDRSQSLITAILPDADIEYEIELSRLDELYFPHPGDLYIEEEVVLYPQDVIDGDDAPDGARPVEVARRRIPVLLNESTVVEPAHYNLNPVLISEQLYLSEAVHITIVTRVVFEFIRIFRDYCFNVSCSDKQCHEICNSKFPVEYLLVRDVPTANSDSANFLHGRNWAKLGHVIQTPVSKYQHVRENLGTGGAPNFLLSHNELEYDLTQRFEPVITEMGVKIHDTDYYECLPRRFFELYLPWVYSCGNWFHDDEDESHPLFVNFSQLPGVTQNWGCAAVSRNRKLQLDIKANLEPSSVFQLDGVVGGSAFSETYPYKKVSIQTNSCTYNFNLGTDGTITPRFC